MQLKVYFNQKDFTRVEKQIVQNIDIRAKVRVHEDNQIEVVQCYNALDDLIDSAVSQAMERICMMNHNTNDPSKVFYSQSENICMGSTPEFSNSCTLDVVMAYADSQRVCTGRRGARRCRHVSDTMNHLQSEAKTPIGKAHWTELAIREDLDGNTTEKAHLTLDTNCPTNTFYDMAMQYDCCRFVIRWQDKWNDTNEKANSWDHDENDEIWFHGDVDDNDQFRLQMACRKDYCTQEYIRGIEAEIDFAIENINEKCMFCMKGRDSNDAYTLHKEGSPQNSPWQTSSHTGQALCVKTMHTYNSTSTKVYLKGRGDIDTNDKWFFQVVCE
jgi:hypothetical protein